MRDSRLGQCPWCKELPRVGEVVFKGKTMYQVSCVNPMCVIQPTTPLFMDLESAKRIWNGRAK